MFSKELLEQASRLLADCRRKNIMIATAESCTGGLIGGLLTEIARSSDVYDRGFITYSNAAKTAQLGVDAELIKRVGAVSEEVAKAMAEGALANSKAQLSVAVTGVAGPGDSENKPAGLVYIAVSTRSSKSRVEKYNFTGGRSEVRLQTVEKAIALLTAQLDHV